MGLEDLVEPEDLEEAAREVSLARPAEASEGLEALVVLEEVAASDSEQAAELEEMAVRDIYLLPCLQLPTTYLNPTSN